MHLPCAATTLNKVYDDDDDDDDDDDETERERELQ